MTPQESTWQCKWERLGPAMSSGGQGSVWHVRNKDSGQHGVMKILHPGLHRNAEERERFQKECRVISRITHVGIPKLLDANVDTSRNELFHVTEPIAGPPLHQFMKTATWTTTEAIQFTIQLTEVVEYLHSCVPAVFHRDIKPANILVPTKNNPILIDFGAAYSDDGTFNVPIYTTEENKLGNDFLQLNGQESTNPRLDLAYCCAILLYLLTRSEPGDLTRSMRKSYTRSKRTSWSTAPSHERRDALLLLLDKGLHPAETQRYDSAQTLRQQLQELLQML